MSGKGVLIPQFLQFLNSPFVLCTNYKVKEYFSLAESNVAFGQESTAHEDTLFSLECGAMPRDNMDPTDMLIDEDPQPAFSVPTGTSVTQAQLFTFFKDMLPLFNCPSSRHRLLESLSANRTEREIQHKSKKRHVASEGSDTTLVSSNVPFDTARESYQNTYHFKRWYLVIQYSKGKTLHSLSTSTHFWGHVSISKYTLCLKMLGFFLEYVSMESNRMLDKSPPTLVFEEADSFAFIRTTFFPRLSHFVDFCFDRRRCNGNV